MLGLVDRIFSSWNLWNSKQNPMWEMFEKKPWSGKRAESWFSPASDIQTWCGLQQGTAAHEAWFLIYQMGLLDWMKSKDAPNSSSQQFLHYGSSKAIMTHSAESFGDTKMEERPTSHFLSELWAHWTVPRETSAKSTLDFTRCENAKRRGEVTSPAQINILLEKEMDMENAVFTFKFKTPRKSQSPYS